jgi:PhnB protein
VTPVQPIPRDIPACRPVENQFYGDRSAQFEDPFGHRWSIATHGEDVDPDEMARRAEQAATASGG